MSISLATVLKGVRVWTTIKPYRRWKERRQAKRAARRAEAQAAGDEFDIYDDEEEGMAINLGTRTSTNALVGGGILSTIYVKAVELLPYPELVAALTTPETIALVATAFAWIVARFSKTADKPGLI